MTSKRGARCPFCWAPPYAQKRKPHIVAAFSQKEPWRLVDPVDGVRCPNCGRGFLVDELECDEEYVYDWPDRMEFTPRYCPNCGHRLGGGEDE